MRNRTHRYNQRSYKHREQERIPEYFVDEDPHFFVYNDSRDWYGYCDDYYGIQNIVYSDCESVDSYSIDCDKKYKKPAKESKKSLASPKNRYAALDIEESYTLLGEDREEEEAEVEATILNSFCKEETEIDESNKCLNDEMDAAVNRIKLIERQEWVASWSKKDDGDEIWWVITVDGFFRKKRKAGYGVMIRDRYGVPILASASGYVKPVSGIYHTLQGIDRGLELAMKYGFYRVYLYYTLPHDIDQRIQGFFENRGSEYRTSYYRDYRYSGLSNYCKGEDEFQLMSPLLYEIEEKCCMFVDHSFIFESDSSEIGCRNTKRRYNIPADYLAKLQVTEKEMKPDEFPEELKDILYADAHNSGMRFYAGFDRRRCSIFPRGIND